MYENCGFKKCPKGTEVCTQRVPTRYFFLFADLSLGKRILMPLSRPLPSILKGLHELRLSGKSAEFRGFYIIKPGDGIYIIHASGKKTESITSMTSSLLKARSKRIKENQRESKRIKENQRESKRIKHE